MRKLERYLRIVMFDARSSLPTLLKRINIDRQIFILLLLLALGRKQCIKLREFALNVYRVLPAWSITRSVKKIWLRRRISHRYEKTRKQNLYCVVKFIYNII